MTITEYSTRNKVRAEEVPIIEIVPSGQNPRKHFDREGIEELAESIREHGLLEPLVVREISAATLEYHGAANIPHAIYEIVAGERRWRACTVAGLSPVPVRILEDVGDAQALKLALVENLQRQDLDPIEEAEGYQQLNRVLGLRQAEIAAAVNRSQPAVAKSLSLLDLPEDVRDRIRNGELTVAHGVAIARYKQFPRVASRLAQMVVEKGWTSHNLEGSLFAAWSQMSTEGLVRSFYPSMIGFGIAVCQSCPFGAYRSGAYNHVCLKPEHFEELEKQAQREKQERLQAASQALADQRADPDERTESFPDESALPKLIDLTHDQYRWLHSRARNPEGCDESCPCLGKALDYHGQVTDICTDPKRYERLEKADRRKRNREVRAEAGAKQERLEELIDGITEIGPRKLALVVSAALSADYRYGSRIRTVSERLGVDISETWDPRRRDYERLAELPPVTQLRIALEVILGTELAGVIENPENGTTARYDWFVNGGAAGER